MTESYLENYADIENNYCRIEKELKDRGIKKAMIVCGSSFDSMKLSGYFRSLEENKGMKFIRFGGFSSNPDIASVIEAKEIYLKENCGAIIAVGGGSAIDTAKCTRLLLTNTNPKKRRPAEKIPFFAVPTTAGSGSEATQFAVVYSNEEKLSVSHSLCLPDFVFYDSTLLETLPLFQRISTALDAFCHCIESLWSINSTDTSMMYAKTALEMIISHIDLYISNCSAGNKKMQEAARYAGMAINISQTTAAHAMSYRLTKLYGIPHGISAGLCLEHIWNHNIQYKRLCHDPRGTEQLEKAFSLISEACGCETASDALCMYQKKFSSFNIPKLKAKKPEDIEILAVSVNKDRLKNSPVPLSFSQIKSIYEKILF